MSAFDDSFAELIGEEGGLSMDPKDRGNWDSGQIGVGTLKGSKYGISAAQYPTLDIANLTLDQAKAIAKRDYWDKVRGDDLPQPVAHALFDCAYNQGVGVAIKLFQKALTVTVDGVFGDGTMAAFRIVPIRRFARAFTIARIVRYSMGPGWMNDANGWTGRALDSFAEMLS